MSLLTGLVTKGARIPLALSLGLAVFCAATAVAQVHVNDLQCEEVYVPANTYFPKGLVQGGQNEDGYPFPQSITEATTAGVAFYNQWINWRGSANVTPPRRVLEGQLAPGMRVWVDSSYTSGTTNAGSPGNSDCRKGYGGVDAQYPKFTGIMFFTDGGAASGGQEKLINPGLPGWNRQGNSFWAFNLVDYYSNGTYKPNLQAAQSGYAGSLFLRVNEQGYVTSPGLSVPASADHLNITYTDSQYGDNSGACTYRVCYYRPRVVVPTATATATATCTFAPSHTPTPVPTATCTVRPSATATPTATSTPYCTFTPTNTATPTYTASPTFTPTPTATAVKTATSTPTPSFEGHALKPLDPCIVPVGQDTYTAYFGYLNRTTGVITVPLGPDNRFTTPPENRGQPTAFQPGSYPRAFSVTFSGTAKWVLKGKQVTASKESPLCEGAGSVTPTATPTPSCTTTAISTPTATPTARATATCTPYGHPKSAASTDDDELSSPRAGFAGNSVKPTLDCVAALPNGQKIAYFGYTNTSGDAVRLPVGTTNRFASGDADRGQPAQFEAGRISNAFSVVMDGSARWLLGSNSATAGSDSPVCEACVGTCRPECVYKPSQQEAVVLRDAVSAQVAQVTEVIARLRSMRRGSVESARQIETDASSIVAGMEMSLANIRKPTWMYCWSPGCEQIDLLPELEKIVDGARELQALLERAGSLSRRQRALGSDLQSVIAQGRELKAVVKSAARQIPRYVSICR